ncbi:zinc-dependent peptidase [Pseudoalteromonas sp. MMG010]|uniref:M90 family metallopeptidase n=1 Tax=Pseudoalteromonas sp. MMG010 TaxID=2822685 RepID=UPI001B3A2FFC|nr:M90 family metallopeptidase [Pseudoalteromonas sp. MMG010]MBQ4833271.1 zinc-dependent peptidase [Pseudoalteromonas sp. MMG010]
MVNALLLLILAAFVVLYWCWPELQRTYWQRKYNHVALTSHEQAILKRYMPIYFKMTDVDRSKLERHIIWFLNEKRFLARDGLTLTAPMKLLIAADACLLVLNKPWPLYKNVKEILLYPSAYYAPQSTRDNAGLVSYHTSVRQGESWPGGTLVLSWHDVLQGNRLPSDGHNLVFHEFAHQLDQQTGKTTGTPALSSKAQYQKWAEVFNRAFTQLKSHVAYNIPHVIDSYGATNEAEFFAVITETFIEKPLQLKQFDPQIYQLLVDYYQFDPKAWH